MTLASAFQARLVRGVVSVELNGRMASAMRGMMPRTGGRVGAKRAPVPGGKRGLAVLIIPPGMERGLRLDCWGFRSWFSRAARWAATHYPLLPRVDLGRRIEDKSLAKLDH